MKLTKLLGFVFLFVLISSLASADLTDNLVSYWKLDNTSYFDELGNFNGVSVGSPTSFQGKINNGSYLDAVTDSINFSKPTYSTTNHSLNLWINTTAWTTSRTFFRYGGSNYDGFYLAISGTNIVITYSAQPSTDYTLNIPHNGLSTNNWHMISIVKNATSAQIYINGVLNSTLSIPSNTAPVAQSFMTIGAAPGSNSLIAVYDELGWWNRSLNSTEITQLFNSDIGLSYPFDLQLNLSITLTNAHNTSYAYQTFNATINGTTYNTTDGTIETNLASNSTSLYNITIEAPNQYAQTYLNYNISTNLAGQTWSSENYFYCYNNISWTPIACNITIAPNTKTNGSAFYLLNNTAYTANISSAGYNSTNYTWTTGTLENTSKAIALYNSQLNLTLFNVVTATNITAPQVNVTYANGVSVIYTGAAGIVYIPAEIGSTFTVSGNNTNTNVADFVFSYTPVNRTERYSYNVSTSNTVYVNVYDENTGSILNSTTWTLELIGDTALYNFTIPSGTTGGRKYLSNLTPDEYVITISDGSYEPRQYVITVGNNSYQVLNAYMIATANASTTIFTIYDETTKKVIEDATVSIETGVAGNWTLISSLPSDINGKVQFSYNPVAAYRLTFAKEGYTTKSIVLNPIIYSTYTVYMSTSGSGDIFPMSDVLIRLSPSVCYNNVQNNFTLQIASSKGILTNYGYYAYASNNASINATGSGLNAYGETFTFDLNVSGALNFDKVIFNYYYNDSIMETQYAYSFNCLIENPNSSTWTAIGNRADNWGMSIFDRVIILVFTLLIAGAIAVVVGGVEGAAAIVILVCGFFIATNFLPWYVVTLPILLGVFVLFGGNKI